jgi:hypothetical protein
MDVTQIDLLLAVFRHEHMSDLVFFDTEVMGWFWTLVVIATLSILHLTSRTRSKLLHFVRMLTGIFIASWLCFYIYAFFNFYPDQKHFDEVVHQNLISLLNKEIDENNPLKLDFGRGITSELDLNFFTKRYNMKYTVDIYYQTSTIEKKEINKVPLVARFNLAIERILHRQWYKYYVQFEFQQRLVWIDTKRMELLTVDVSRARVEENL